MATTVTITKLKPADGDEARRFCLAVIKEAYGLAYRPDWHADLDDLLNLRPDSWKGE